MTARTTKVPIHESRHMRVVCIGAGIAGIAAAYAHKQQTNIEFVVYEKNEDVGGTWFENRYPGCACDIPAHSYTYSWEGNPLWSRFYVEAEEIFDYFKGCAVKWDLMKHIKLEHQVRSADWIEEASEWKLLIDGPGGEVVHDRCNVLISASGVLNKWKWPKIEGLHDFGGLLLHPSRWPTECDLRGKTVAIIGSGSSAIQLVPKLQPVAKHLKSFFRSPTWITPEYNERFALEGRKTVYSTQEIERFSSDEQYLLDYRKMLLNASTNAFDVYYKGSELQKKAFAAYTELMRARLQGHEEICDKLIPGFEVGCRRLSPGSGYLESLIADNVTCVFDSIREVNTHGIVTCDGVQHEVDVIICATGFDVSNRPAFPIRGRNGIDLREFWKHNPIHYLSVAAPGFPNYFIAGGPNAPISNVSLIIGLEAAVNYAFACVQKMQTENIRSMDATLEATNEFLAQRDKMMKDMVWSGGCSSWYKMGTKDGPVTGPWVGSVWHYVETLAFPRWEDYTLRSLQGNRFSYLGTGRTRAEMEGEDVAGKFLR